MRICFLLLPLASAAFLDSASTFFSGSARRVKRSYPPVTEAKAKQYLQQFGYVSPSGIHTKGGTGSKGAYTDAKAELKAAVQKFQKFGGLRQTGELDRKTLERMAAPRCGQPDVQFMTDGSTVKWSKNELTYSIENWSPDLPKAAISKAISDAFGLWAAVTPLTITEVEQGEGDIKISFGADDHGDPWPFDGRGHVLAHATFPEHGDLHFDEAENWAYMDEDKIAGSYTDLFAVAIHEAGHTLGLDHSTEEGSIMGPFIDKTVDEDGRYVTPSLTDQDIENIQEIYGKDGEEEFEETEEEDGDGEKEEEDTDYDYAKDAPSEMRRKGKRKNTTTTQSTTTMRRTTRPRVNTPHRIT